MKFDVASYVMGHTKGKADADREVIIEGTINCVDDGNGNITITEDN